MFKPTNIYLLVNHHNGDEYVFTYTPVELTELFTASEIERLAAGKVIIKGSGNKTMTVADMVVAARDKLAQ